MSSNARESSSVYLTWTWTKVSHCSYAIRPQDGTIGPLEEKTTTQPTPGAVLASYCCPGVRLGLLGFPRAAHSADKSQWH